jgi:hypothetical protein
MDALVPVSEPLEAKVEDRLRAWLRGRLSWIRFQELNREGWRPAWRRRGIQRTILATPPVYKDRGGDTEVRVLTWRRDWINLIWALKSFYHFSGVRFPLYIHDGSLLDDNIRSLLAHFPNATFVSRADADIQVETQLSTWRCDRSLAYRRRSSFALKLFDFFLLSRARTVISIGSDIVFFRTPLELLQSRPHLNLYNRDLGHYYCLSPDEIRRRFGLQPVPLINSGLCRVARESIDFQAIQDWLHDDDLFTNYWLTEQTLHAMCSSRHGAELLPETIS